MRIYLSLMLLVLAGAAGVLGLRHRLWWRVLRRTEVRTPDELVEAAEAGRLRRRVRAVIGVAGPAKLSSTVNGEACVWHRHTVRHRQVRYSTGRNGRSRRSASNRQVADVSSAEMFALTGVNKQVVVLPANMRVTAPERRGSRILPGIASQPIPDAADLFSGGTVRNSYHHREWIIRAGTPLYILGEVTGSGAGVAVRRPANGLHIISTRDARKLIRRALGLMILGFAAAAISLIGGLALIVNG